MSGQDIVDDAADKAAAAAAAAYQTSPKALYIGVDAGSDLETNGIRKGTISGPFGSRIAAPHWFSTRRKPRYRVGYQHSEAFRKEILAAARRSGMDPEDVLALIQEQMARAGMLDKFHPGEWDAPTRKAFKEVLATANQTATSWQQTLGRLGEGEVGPGTEEPERDPFVAVLDDPVTLRETFQSAAQKLYGGDLPDAEVNAMVDAFRAQQLAKQKAKYDADPVGGQVDQEVAPDAYVSAEIKAKHPDQVAKVEFNGTLSSLFAETAKTGGGLM